MANIRDRLGSWFNNSPLARRAFASLLFLIGAVALTVAIRRSLTRDLDINVILNASRNLLDGTDIYATPASNGAYYLYTPLLALLFSPLTLVPQSNADLVWTLACIGLLAWSLHEIVKLISADRYRELQPFEKWLLYLVPLILCADAISAEIGNAQVNCLILAAAILGLKLVNEKREAAAGALLGIALVAKIFTAPLLLSELLAKRLRLAAAAIAAIVLNLFLPAAVAGWQTNIGYLRYWMTNIALHGDLASHRSGFAGNVSPAAVLARLLTDVPAFTLDGTEYRLNIADLDPSTLNIVGIEVPLFALASLVLYYAFFRNSPRLVSYWGGVALASAIAPLITPVLERPHFVLLLPAYVYVVWLWLHERLRSKLFYSLIITAWVLSTFTLKLYVGQFWGNVFWALGAPMLADLCLLAAIFIAAVRLRNPNLTHGS
jgi:hypothetical protein